MNTKAYTQQLVDDLLTLPKDKIVEVADFVHFLKEKIKHQGISLADTGLTEQEAFDLRKRLATFEDDWNAPGMEAYDKL